MEFLNYIIQELFEPGLKQCLQISISLSIFPFFSSIFLSRFFLVFHLNSAIFPAKEKRKLHLLNIYNENSQVCISLIRTRSHTHPSSEGKCSEEGGIGPTQTSWIENFPKKNWSAITPTERNGHRENKAKDIYHIKATCQRRNYSLDMYNLVHIAKIANFPQCPFFLSLFW